MDEIKQLSISGAQINRNKINDKDRILTRINFLLLGIASLISLYSIINSLDFFQKQYPQFNTVFYLTIPPQIGVIITSLLMPFLVSKLSTTVRTLSGLVFMIFVIIISPLISLTMSQNSLGFALLLVVMFFSGIFRQLLANSSIGVAVKLDYLYLNDYNLGCTLSSMIMLIFRVIAITSFPDQHQNAATIMYFSVGAAWTAFTIVVFLVFRKGPVYGKVKRVGGERETPIGSFYF